MNTLSTYLLDPPIDGIREVQLALTSPIGAGANARVYKEKIGNDHYAIKIYSDPNKCNVPKLRAMLQNPPDIYGEHSSINYPLFGWVLSLLIDKKSQFVIGFVMPLIDDQKSKTLDYFYDSILSKKLASTSSKALSFKIEILLNLCRAIDDLHKRGHKFVDLKPQNLRVFEGTNIVSLIDCDGYTILDKTTGNEFRADMVSTDYIAPEINKLDFKKDAIPKSQDDYALAVIIFQMLNRGIHPFQGIIKSPNIFVSTNDEKAVLGLYPYGQIKNDKATPLPISIHDMLLDETRVLFDRAFSTQNRPSSKEWAEHFQDIISNKKIVRCKEAPTSIEHMRFRDKDCPECRKPMFVTKSSIAKPSSLTTDKTAIKTAPNSNGSKHTLSLIIIMGLFIAPVIWLNWFYSSNSDKGKERPIITNNSTIVEKSPGNVNNTENLMQLFACNWTDKVISLAVSFDEGGKQKIIGWYNVVPKGECLDIGIYNKNNLFWYARSNETKEWAGKQGQNTWCVDLREAFMLPAQETCAPGQVKKPFNEITSKNIVHRLNLR